MNQSFKSLFDHKAWSDRSIDSLSSLLTYGEEQTHEANFCFALAESDVGVQLNGGRRGSALGPRAILSQLSRVQRRTNDLIPLRSVTQLQLEEINYSQSIELQSKRLADLHQYHSTIIHIGGGHDHVFSLGMSIPHDYEILIINIDAHADTRLDNWPHSGNPFRRLDQHRKIKIFQLGLHPFSNSEKTLTPLKQGKMHLFYRSQLESQLELVFGQMAREISPKTWLLFSLDFDGLDLSKLSAVSAPNPNGVSPDFVDRIIKWTKNQTSSFGTRASYGFYEFNPLYDNLSGNSARVGASLIYNLIQ